MYNAGVRQKHPKYVSNIKKYIRKIDIFAPTASDKDLSQFYIDQANRGCN